MNQIWTIMRREYVERVRQRSFLIGTILVPVFILAVTFGPAYLAMRTSGQAVHLAVVDLTGSLKDSIEPAFTDTLATGTPRFAFDWHRTDGGEPNKLRESLQTEVRAGTFTGLLWIPKDALTGGSVELYAMSTVDPELAARLRDAVSRAAMSRRLAAYGVSPDQTEAISKTVPLKAFKLTKEGAKESGFESDFFSMLLFAMVLYMTILIYGVSVQRSILEEKNSRIVEILLKAARPFQLMTGKIIGIGAVGVTQYAIWGLVASAGAAYIRGAVPSLAQATVISPMTFFFFVVYFLLGYLLYSAMYAATGAMATSDQEAQQLQMPITTLIVVPMLLMMMIVRNPGGTMSTVLSLIPFFTPVLMMMRISLQTPPVWQLVLSIVILGVSVLGISALAGRIFRVGILMYGKRPTLPEIVRWIKAA
jgi:ABC-2 type transport system permease protein